MNGQLAKKLRKYSRKAWWEYVMILQTWPLEARLRFAWAIIFKRR